MTQSYIRRNHENLQKLVTCCVEHESSHAETKQFCKQKRRYGAKPIAGGDETQPDEFHRQHDDKRDDKHNQRRIGRQIFNPPGNCNLELAPGNEIDDTRDYRLEVIL